MISVSLVGRPNVGKSTLFNVLVKKRSALTHSIEGTTRDRITERVEMSRTTMVLHDLAGYGPKISYKKDIELQLFNAIDLSDILLFVVSAPSPQAEDFEFVERLRSFNKICILVVNKIDLLSDPSYVHDFYRLGITKLVGISAEHRINIDDLIHTIEDQACSLSPDINSDINPDINSDINPDIDPDINIDKPNYDSSVVLQQAPDTTTDGNTNIILAMLGKPNSGKSSLFNLLLAKERSIVSDIAGTTRDMIKDGFAYKGKNFLIIDTPGLRQKKRITDKLEYYSGMRSIEAVRLSNVIIIVVDATIGVSQQDRVLLSLCARAGTPTILFYNKMDMLDQHARMQTASQSAITRRLGSLTHGILVRGSALDLTHKTELLDSVIALNTQSQFSITTHALNDTIQRIYNKNPPPLVKNRRGKITYAYKKSSVPLHIALRVNSPQYFSDTYRRYLTNNMRKAFNTPNIPILLTIEKKY